MPIPCFDNFQQLKDKFLKLIKEDMPEAEQKEIGRELALEYHKELYGELSKFKKSIGIKNIKPYEAPKVDEEKIKKITDEYEAAIEEINNQNKQINQPTSKESEAGKVSIEDIGRAKTKQQELADKVRALKVNLSKLSGGGLQSNPLGLPVAVWNGAMDIVAKAIETGGDIADAIKRGLNYIQKNHRGQWDKKGFNDQVMKELGVRGITVNGEDFIVKNDAKTEREFAETVNGWYSDLEQNVLDIKGDKASGQSWKKVLGKSDEAKWTGLNEWLSQQKGTVSKKDILNYLKDNRIEIVEVVKDDRRLKILPDQTAITKFSQYQLEGQKENYKEVLVTMPSATKVEMPKPIETYTGSGKYKLVFDNGNQLSGTYTKEEVADVLKRRSEDKTGMYIDRNEQFKSSHFEEPNILVHLRMNTRVDAEGKKVLFLEEVQSDWGQKGKKEGFDSEKNDYKAIADRFAKGLGFTQGSEADVKLALKRIKQKSNIWEREYAAFKEAGFSDAEINKMAADYTDGQTPSAPFVTDTNSWTKLGLKVALKEAVKQGVDKIAWSTGTQQFDRWGSEKIDWQKAKERNLDRDNETAIFQKKMYDKYGMGWENKYTKEESQEFRRLINLPKEKQLGGWSINIEEQSGGNAFNGMNLNEKALSENNVIVKTKDDLRKAFEKNLKRERNESEIEKLTDRIWNRMQTEDSGTSLPRKEGMEGFYGVPSENKLGIVGNVAKSLFKQEPKTVTIKTNKEGGYELGEANYVGGTGVYHNGDLWKEFDTKKEAQDYIDKYNKSQSTQHSIDITPELKAEVEGGLPLFKDIKGRGKELADLLRKGKIKLGGLQSNIAGIPIAVYNGAIEVIARALETGATLTQAINKAYKQLKIKERFKDFNQSEFIKNLEDATGEKFIEDSEGAGGGKPPTGEGKVEAEMQQPGTELSFKGLQEVANEFGYEDVKSRDRVTDLEELENAKTTAEQWASEGKYQRNIDNLLSKIENKELVPTAKQRLILQQYLANESEKLRGITDKTSKEYTDQFEKVKYIKKVGQIARQEAGAALRIAEGRQSHPINDLVDATIVMEEANGNIPLSEKQKQEVDLMVKQYEERAKVAEQKTVEMEKKFAELQALKGIEKAKKSRQEYKSERDKIRQSIKDKWKSAGQDILSSDIPFRKQLAAISPDVVKLVKSYVQEGVTEFSEVVKKVHDFIKDFNPNIKEEDVVDMIAGKYDEVKETQADLIKKLNSIRDKKSAEAIKIRARIKAGDFAKKEPSVSWVNNPEIKKQFPKEYNEALDAITKREEAKLDFDIAVYKAQRAQRTKAKKGIDFIRALIATTKAVKSGIDDSAIMMQNIVAMVAHPRSAVKALKEHALDALSEKRFRRYLTELHNSPIWPLIEKSGLDITDPKSLKEQNKEEIFDNNLLNKDFKIGGKKFNVGKYVTRPFERAFTSLGNAMRVNMFTNISQRMYAEGKTFETHPEEFKSLARVLNTETGRGKLHTQIERASQLITAGIWSPRLMASRLNMLGLSELLPVVGGKPGYYSGLPPEIRKMAIADITKFLGAGVGLMLFAGSRGADVDDDPESPTFGTIKIGDKKYNAWGGFTPYAKTIFQGATGKRKINGQRVDITKGKLIANFFRSRLTPAASVTTNLLVGKDYANKPITLEGELINLTAPLSVSAIIDGLKKDGIIGILNQGIPSFVGIGVSDERDFQKNQNKPERPKIERPKPQKIARE